MFSKIVRRSHMYLALFLVPWILMYALSTMAMNHREFFKQFYGEQPVAWERERELTYPGTFPEDAKPNDVARQILVSLGMDGAHNANRSKDGARLTIVRHDAITPQRITYTPADGRLVIESQVFRTPAFLERMHRRRGYQSDYRLDDTWAFSVDLVIAAMIFWVASGLWMWWEMKVTRRLGFAFAASGVAIFALFLSTI